MKRLIALTAALLLFQFSASALEENRQTIFGSEELLIEVDLSSRFDLVAKSSDFSAEYVHVNLTLFPKETALQQVQFTQLQPTAVVTDKSLLFIWDKPKPGKLSYSAVADVVTTRSLVPVTHKVAFPIAELPSDIAQYTLPTENIDSDNQGIELLASSLAAGEDDLFVVVFKLAEWSNTNINYNLSTLTADVTKNASWVLQTRQGVCDEFTNLFIALNRALGIPARFVSGISYTDSELFQQRWGFHGWAEVYFPGYGWVPFDVTYGEFGFVDPGHIQMISTADVAETTTGYQWKGRNIDVVTSQLTPRITLKDASGSIQGEIALRSKILKDSVGFGSYNIEEVEVTNFRNYYTVAELVHANTQELELIGPNKRDILLKPGETKLEYFVFRVSGELNEDYVYTFPLTVIAHLAETSTEFKSNSAAPAFSLDEVNALRIEQEEEKAYSRNVGISCTAQEKIYIYENAEVSCTAKNTGNVALNNLRFCHNGECERFTLGLTRSKQFDFTANFTSPGTNRIKVSVDSDTVAKTETVEIYVLDKPSLSIQDIMHPESVKFNEAFEVSFLVKKTSETLPINAEVSVRPAAAKFHIDALDNGRKLTAELSALELKEGENAMTITATFYDEKGRKYTEQEQFAITVEELNFLQKIRKFLLKLFR
ncbi:transglutaminase domain-containing protein [Candidatus Woesearchaeota archaeon]|nr:transglutaminase domain-containing protein [Candidatus Woesearchaeota archaeon]